jgi:hypothetical protein
MCKWLREAVHESPRAPDRAPAPVRKECTVFVRRPRPARPVRLIGVSFHFDADEIEGLVRTVVDAVNGDPADLSDRQRELVAKATDLMNSQMEGSSGEPPTEHDHAEVAHTEPAPGPFACAACTAPLEVVRRDLWSVDPGNGAIDPRAGDTRVTCTRCAMAETRHDVLERLATLTGEHP